MKEVCKFTATLPPIQSAISLDGRGDGARIKFDVPGSELPEVLKLNMLYGQAFDIVVYAREDEGDES